MSGPFHPTAHVYDIVYSHLDYEGHADVVDSIVAARRPEAASLLDVACGTGRHLEAFAGRYRHVEGADVDPAMLAVARRRLPGVPLHEADMRTLRLGKRFDIVTCLFSSIGYMRTLEDLRRAVRSMAGHLVPGGVLVVEPWLWPSMIESPGKLRHMVREGDDAVVARTTRWLNPDTALRERVSRMEFAYLITTADGSRLAVERHDMGLFTPAEYVAAVEAAGLAAEFDREGTSIGRGLAIGVAPAAPTSPGGDPRRA